MQINATFLIINQSLSSLELASASTGPFLTLFIILKGLPEG